MYYREKCDEKFCKVYFLNKQNITPRCSQCHRELARNNTSTRGFLDHTRVEETDQSARVSRRD